MDIDIDIDPEIARLQASTAALNALPSAMEADTTNNAADIDTMVEDGEVAAGEAIANKIHISGDMINMASNDLKNFASDNYDKEAHVEIEWVNDLAANLVFRTDAAAAAALKAFSVTPVEDPLESRRAKDLVTNPEAELYVRQALVTDVKVQGAAKQSRFYLTNPEYDPENKSRSSGRGGGRGRGRGRGGYRHGGGAQDDRIDRSRRSSTIEKNFSVDMYDDIKDSAPTGPRGGRRSSNYSSYSGEDLFAGRQGGRNTQRPSELVGNRRDGRLRDRSASPIRDGREGDGRYGFSDDQPHRQTARRRTPLRDRSIPDNKSASKAIRADLFANRKPTSALQNGDGTNGPIELFPFRGGDLFQDKIDQKRQDEKQLRAADLTSKIGECKLDHETDVSYTYAIPPRAKTPTVHS